MSGPRVVVGLPLYNQARHLPETLESWRGQTFGDIAVLLSDDGSEDGTADIARAAAAADSRFILLPPAARRLGYVGNCRRLLDDVRDRFPDAEFFTWGSDHDLWHPYWAERLVSALDARPDAALAYSLTHRIDEEGRVLRRVVTRFDTAGLDDPGDRFRRTAAAMVAGEAQAGNMIYGLFRLSALAPQSPPRLLLPDRVVVLDAACAGCVLQVPEFLWLRRFEGIASLARQRRSLFPRGVPLGAWMPVWLTHSFYLARRHGAGLGMDYAAVVVPALVSNRAKRAWTHGRRAIGYGVVKPLVMRLHRLRKRVRGKAAGLARRLRGRA